jgi:hypothetical protein
MGKALEIKLNDNLETLQRNLVSDPQCRYPNSDSPRSPDGPADAPSGGGQCIARPDWVFDPSGKVYEGLPSRPVAGVTATVLRSDSAEGPWQVWDAAPYDQLNPQRTGTHGEYAWDVPRGWWKVRWEGPGWLPAESRALHVLPPHTDVDQSLVRTELATVEAASADPTGITVTFTQPVRVAVASRPGMLSAAARRAAGSRWIRRRPGRRAAGPGLPLRRRHAPVRVGSCLGRGHGPGPRRPRAGRPLGPVGRGRPAPGRQHPAHRHGDRCGARRGVPAR